MTPAQALRVRALLVKLKDLHSSLSRTKCNASTSPCKVATGDRSCSYSFAITYFDEESRFLFDYALAHPGVIPFGVNTELLKGAPLFFVLMNCEIMLAEIFESGNCCCKKDEEKAKE